MSVQGNIVQDSHCLDPCLVELVKFDTTEIIETGGIKAACIDIVKMHDNIRVTEVEFLIKGEDFPNEFGSLLGHINCHGVVTLHSIAKMLQVIHPGQRNTSQLDRICKRILQFGGGF